MTDNLPIFLPLSEAARRYQIPIAVLTRRVRDGKLEAVQLASGEVAVSEEQLKTKAQIIAEKYAGLVGQPLTISEAVEKYKAPGMTIRDWVTRGYITVIDDGYPMRLDEADVAYCVEAYRQRKAAGSLSGAPLLDEDGRPYVLKRPELAEYRRRRKECKVA